jgi:hypothetical protein
MPKIKDLPKIERPRERFLAKGPMKKSKKIILREMIWRQERTLWLEARFGRQSRI